MAEHSGTLLRTACYDQHVLAGANLVNFHGYELPMWYTNIREEHLVTRTHVGLFDVSHIGFFNSDSNTVSSVLFNL